MKFCSVSIVTPTFNRPDHLRRLLGSVVELQYPADRFELILADDGSALDVRRVLAEFASRPIRIRYLRLDHRGVAAARNEALARLTGDVVLFTDDDCVLDPAILATLNRIYRDEAVDGAFGRVRGFESNWFSTYSSRTHCNRNWEKYTMNNVSFRREIVDRVRFDESRATYEDVDYVRRCERLIRARGHRFVRADTIVWHRSAENLAAFMAPAVRAGYGYLSFHSAFRPGFLKNLFVCLFPFSFPLLFLSYPLFLGVVLLFGALMGYRFIVNGYHGVLELLLLPGFAWLAALGFCWGAARWFGRSRPENG